MAVKIKKSSGSGRARTSTSYSRAPTWSCRSNCRRPARLLRATSRSGQVWHPDRAPKLYVGGVRVATEVSGASKPPGLYGAGGSNQTNATAAPEYCWGVGVRRIEDSAIDCWGVAMRRV